MASSTCHASSLSCSASLSPSGASRSKPLRVKPSFLVDDPPSLPVPTLDLSVFRSQLTVLREQRRKAAARMAEVSTSSRGGDSGGDEERLDVVEAAVAGAVVEEQCDADIELSVCRLSLVEEEKTEADSSNHAARKEVSATSPRLAGRRLEVTRPLPRIAVG